MLIDCGYESGFNRSFGVSNASYKMISRSAIRKIPSSPPTRDLGCWLSLPPLTLENRPCLLHCPPVRSTLAAPTSRLNSSSSIFSNSRHCSSSNNNSSSNLPPRKSSRLMAWRFPPRLPPILISLPLPQPYPSPDPRRQRHPLRPPPNPPPTSPMVLPPRPLYPLRPPLSLSNNNTLPQWRASFRPFKTLSPP